MTSRSRGQQLIHLATKGKKIVGAKEIDQDEVVQHLSLPDDSSDDSCNSSVPSSPSHTRTPAEEINRKVVRRLSFSSSPSHISATESSSDEDCEDFLNDQTYDPKDDDDDGEDSADDTSSKNAAPTQDEIQNLTPVDMNIPCTSSKSVSSSSDKTSSCSTGKSNSPAAPIFVSPANKGLKRRRNSNEWKRNNAKKLRNSGQEYQDRKKKIHAAKSVKPPCEKEHCRIKCAELFSEAERQEIFSAFWKLGSIEKQRLYIADCMKLVNPKYRYVREGAKDRQKNNSFHLTRNGESVRVCKKFFRNTLDINDRVIRTVIDKRQKVASHVLEEDGRGKHQKHPSIDANILAGVRQHIDSIPRIESHYIRSKSSRQYIDGSKSIADIHRDYTAVCQEKGEAHASYTTFYRIFTKEFNFSFFTPKKDLCETCVSYQNSDDAEKSSKQEKYDQHLREKELARAEKKADKENFSGVLAVYDLQAVMQLPKGDASVFYYRSKLNVFNFTIYDLKSGSCQAYVWDEASGHRGINELGSCVLKYLEKKKSSDDTELIFYSDNCAGQQKNKFMVALYLYAVQCLGIKSITHKFLIKGHTQNEGDSIHSLIERQVKRQLKGGAMYTPEAFVSAIKGAKKKGEAIQVTEMSFEDFVDIKDLASKIGPLNMKSLKLTDVKVLQINRESPSSVFYKTSFEDTEFTEAKVISKKSVGDKNIIPKRAFQFKPQLPENKRKDLLDLLEKNYIPKVYEPFFKNL